MLRFVAHRALLAGNLARFALVAPGPRADARDGFAAQRDAQVVAALRELESGGEAEISSEAIGEIVMEHLRQLDDVAYVRFASVYRNFREAKDFEEFISDLAETNLKD